MIPVGASDTDASGTDSDTNANVTGYITPDLYIHGVGVFNAQSSFVVTSINTPYLYQPLAVENGDVVYSFNSTKIR